MSDQQVVMQAIITEAHAKYTQPRQIAAHVASELERLRGSGVEWVEQEINRATVDGLMKKCSSWRAQRRTTVRTKKGNRAEVPAWAGVSVVAPSGSIEYHQMQFDDLTRNQVEASLNRMAKQRNTLSVDIAIRKQVLDYMDEHPECVRAGDAMAALGIAA